MSLTNILTIATFIISRVYCVYEPCNYVGFAKFYNEQADDRDENRSPRATNVCETDRENATSVQSEILLCTPWNEPVLFKFDTANCAGGKPMVYNYESGDYECGGKYPCDAFKVRSNQIEGDNCVENTEQFEEFSAILDECWIEEEDNKMVSIKASCDFNGLVTYGQYHDNLDCSGTPTVKVEATDGSGECPDVPSGEGGMSPAYFGLKQCGQPEYPNDAPTCSYISGAVYNQTEGWCCDNNGTHQERQRPRTTDNVMAMGFNVCTNELENGQFSSQLVFCSYELNMAWIAEWHNLSAPSQCNSRPDEVYTITEWTEMACSPDPYAPCDHIFFRTSEFEDATGDGSVDCAFGDNFKEMRIVTDKCWENKGMIAKATCDGGELTYTVYKTDNNCQNNVNGTGMVMENDNCYDFESDGPFQVRDPTTPGNYSYWQAIECNGEQLSNNERPDCKYVENPRWRNAMGEEEHDNDGFKIPIGVCINEESENDQRDMSYMFICPPWGGVVLVEWDDIDCDADGLGIISYSTHVEYSDYNCQSDTYCDYVLVQANKVSDTGSGCRDNVTDSSEKAFVINSCTNGYKTDGITSINIECTTDTLTYNIFNNKADCPGTADMSIPITPTQRCANFGNDNTMFIEILHCGAFVSPTTSTECSYIINPIYNSSDLGYEERDGAFPLSIDLCLTNRNGENTQSQMYACEPNSKMPFTAIWNTSSECKGKPDAVEIIWSGAQYSEEGFVCQSMDINDCKYLIVQTSQIENVSLDCGPQIRMEESARLINQCWEDKEDPISYKANCFDDEITVKKFNGYSCEGNAIEIINVAHNECTNGFAVGNNRTYFDVVYCSEMTSITTTTTQEPIITTTTEEPTTTEETCEPDNYPKKLEKVATYCEICLCNDGTYDDDDGPETNNNLNSYGYLPDCQEFTIDGITPGHKRMIKKYCNYECELDELNIVGEGKCSCDGFTCVGNTGKGNMLKVIGLLVSVLFHLVV